MGAEIVQEGEYILASCRRLRGIEYRFPAKTVTGTENLIMAAALAEGTTVLSNCALEPEIADLIALLTEMGAPISGQNSETIRIEAGTYLIAGCCAGNDIRILNMVPGHLQSLIEVLGKMGAQMTADGETMRVQGAEALVAADIVTEPYPGYPTDLQAQLTTLLTQASGVSRVRERIFNDRFRHVGELNRLGADIQVERDTAVIRGPSRLRGAVIKTTDLRASAALVLGGLLAAGETIIENSYQLFRGYENMPLKLQNLGAQIKIIEE
jgi:UDP-N-acetylglucosamine 1-carboxyvinyltransferase